jgi:hypothetical protein
MTAAARQRTKLFEPESANLPRYELRLVVLKAGVYELEIWQLPSPSTPRLTAAEYVASLKGPALRLMEPRILKRLARNRINLGSLTAERTREWAIDEELALNMGLLFRALAPMRNLDRIRQVADGVDEMSREEAGYWLGMAMHRKRPRRVLAALRLLLTET